jgi:hypothetical protein
MKSVRLGILVAAVAMCAASNMSKKPSEKSSKDIEKEPAALTVTAAEILAGHDQNELLWDQKFRNKVVSVTGVIKGIEHAALSDDPVVTLEPPKSDDPDKQEFTFDRVTCYLAESQVAKATQLKAGDTLTVKGKVRNWSLGPDLTPCVLP